MNKKSEIPKILHLLSGALCTLAAFALAFAFPDLYSDANNTFALITGTIGVYATIFAIIELLRLRSVTAVIESSMESMANDIHNLQDLRSFQDCQHTVERLFEIIDAGETSPCVLIHSLVKNYTHCFYEEMEDDTSLHRKNRSNLQMFFTASTAARKKTATQELKTTLISITSQISGSTAKALRHHSRKNSRGSN